ncbi:unnamed protein product [Trichogramma brassicae]|uniref:Uncharacterized protein n=1 Tax=Trichogramma brassicae TaxID=86971 RepID=A0A6H5IE99_9HYME|nr:unnamed protein product [Trichogramma brassicae]
MFCDGFARSSRRELYAHVIDSILLHGAPIWRCAMETQAYIRQAEAVHRRACLRVISGRPHVSYDTTYVIASVPPLALLVDERARIYQRRPEDVKEEERRETLSKWQDRWDRASKGRWTHRLIPNITEWEERGHGERTLPGLPYLNRRRGACVLSLPTISRREGETSTSHPRSNRAGKHRQAHARDRRQLDGGIVFLAISHLKTEARGARDVKRSGRCCKKKTMLLVPEPLITTRAASCQFKIYSVSCYFGAPFGKMLLRLCVRQDAISWRRSARCYFEAAFCTMLLRSLI